MVSRDAESRRMTPTPCRGWGRAAAPRPPAAARFYRLTDVGQRDAYRLSDGPTASRHAPRSGSRPFLTLLHYEPAKWLGCRACGPWIVHPELVHLGLPGHGRNVVDGNSDRGRQLGLPEGLRGS